MLLDVCFIWAMLYACVIIICSMFARPCKHPINHTQFALVLFTTFGCSRGHKANDGVVDATRASLKCNATATI